MGDNSPVYEILSKRDPKLKTHVLHRDLLLACNELPVETKSEVYHGKTPGINIIFRTNETF